jgi:hypothetical protein
VIKYYQVTAALYWASLFLHAPVTWQGAAERVCALLAGVLVLGMTIAMARCRAFATRAVVELREDPSEKEEGLFTITASGQPATAEVTKKSVCRIGD